MKTYFSLLLIFVFYYSPAQNSKNLKLSAQKVLQDSILLLANDYINDKPVTITSVTCKRSKGGIHDFYSEGDYWWPDPENPNGPYIRKDGQSNPDNFNKHRELLYRLSIITGNLASAYLITHDNKYAKAIVSHLNAWFIDSKTKMNPNLHYSQAIKGRCEGRYIGIIDGIQLLEVAQAVRILEEHHAIPVEDLTAIKKWFSDYLHWLIESDYGKKEKAHPNNHGTWWNVQASMYARLTNNENVMDHCRENYLNVLLPRMAENGSFPEELKRTKPYAYSLFNLEAMTMNCMLLSTDKIDLWKYTDNNKSIEKAIAFMIPYLKNKSAWPYPPDVMHWNDWPVAMPSTLFGAIEYNREEWFRVWGKAPHFLSPDKKELIRNIVIRNPLIWLEYLGD
jgi:hypothetical protein